jgi:hypothetical protein
MLSRKDELRKWANEYITSTGKTVYTSREIADWAIKKGYWDLPKEKLISICADELARVFKEERFTDPSGNRVRFRHARKVDIDGVQTTLWENWPTISRDNMETSLLQRRNQIVGECVQLDIDTESFNRFRNKGEPIQIPFDFTPDVAEHRIMRTDEKPSSSEPSQPFLQSSDIEQKSILQPVPSRP